MYFLPILHTKHFAQYSLLQTINIIYTFIFEFPDKNPIFRLLPLNYSCGRLQSVRPRNSVPLRLLLRSSPRDRHQRQPARVPGPVLLRLRPGGCIRRSSDPDRQGQGQGRKLSKQ